MIDVDIVEPGGFLAEPGLAGTGLADLDRFPLQNFGPAGLMDSDRAGHGGQMGAGEPKEKPRRGETASGALAITTRTAGQPAA